MSRKKHKKLRTTREYIDVDIFDNYIHMQIYFLQILQILNNLFLIDHFIIVLTHAQIKRIEFMLHEVVSIRVYCVFRQFDIGITRMSNE